MENTICEHCGKAYIAHRNYREQKYCSKRCNDLHYQKERRERDRKAHRKTNLCPVCKQPFVAHDTRQVYCGITCKTEHTNQIRKERTKKSQTGHRKVFVKNDMIGASMGSAAEREKKACDRVVRMAWLLGDSYERKAIEARNPGMTFDVVEIASSMIKAPRVMEMAEAA